MKNINNPLVSAQSKKPNILHRVLTKMGFGVNEHDKQYIMSLSGSSLKEKVLVYIEEQLSPEKIEDEFVVQLLSKGFQTLNISKQEIFQNHVRRPDGNKISHVFKRLPRYEAVIATYIRAVHSKKQLYEMMVDFWHNHFNIHAWNKYTQAMIMNYDCEVIRKNALGNFRQMLMDVSQSTCMLHYLGNGYNEKTAPNENFARELLELFTLGANHYYGHKPAKEVSVDGSGRRTGFVEEDVLELARMLTGWSFDGADVKDYTKKNVATGLFKFRSEWHDKNTKVILGNEYAYDTNKPLKNYSDFLDRLAEHPATAGFLAEKLCRRFVSDKPSKQIVAKVKNALHKNWQDPEQIKKGMEVLLTSSEFLDSWGEKIKRPLELLVSTMRHMGYSYDFDPTLTRTRTHFGRIIDSGQAPFRWALPTGYPDEKNMWMNFSSTMNCWKYIQWMTTHVDVQGQRLNNIVNLTEAAFQKTADITPNNTVAYWYQNICGVHPDAQVLKKLVDFMSQKHVLKNSSMAADKPLDLTSNNWPDYNQDRLISMVSIIFLTDDFRRK